MASVLEPTNVPGEYKIPALGQTIEMLSYHDVVYKVQVDHLNTEWRPGVEDLIVTGVACTEPRRGELWVRQRRADGGTSTVYQGRLEFLYKINQARTTLPSEETLRQIQVIQRDMFGATLAGVQGLQEVLAKYPYPKEQTKEGRWGEDYTVKTVEQFLVTMTAIAGRLSASLKLLGGPVGGEFMVAQMVKKDSVLLFDAAEPVTLAVYGYAKEPCVL